MSDKAFIAALSPYASGPAPKSGTREYCMWLAAAFRALPEPDLWKVIETFPEQVVKLSPYIESVTVHGVRFPPGDWREWVDDVVNVGELFG